MTPLFIGPLIRMAFFLLVLLIVVFVLYGVYKMVK